MSSTVTHRPTAAVPALTLVFALNGMLLAQTLSRMPTLRDQVQASPARLGLALLAVGVGSIVAMPWTARLAERFGSPAVVAVAGVLTTASLSTLALVPDPSWLTLNLFVVGIGVGVWDVSMNVQGNTLEHRHQRVLMPRLHAGFSAGAVVGALTGAGFALLGAPLLVQLPAMSALGLALLLWCARCLTPDVHRRAARRGADHPARRTGHRSRMTGLELVLGLLTFSTALGEGAANDWLALVLVDERGALESVGALTFAAFNLAMALGRFFGGKLIARHGRVAVLRVAGVCAVTGVLLVALVPSLSAAILGGLLWGLGLSVVFPAAMSAAGEVPGRGPRAIGVVSTIGYAGFLAGAPTIGLVAERIGLDHALVVVAGVCTLILGLAGTARERAQPSATAARPASNRATGTRNGEQDT
ncbi:MAG TPA: MFS transporter [Nocardioidaceae bacterium]|nr:MFS transporter [Nocardioidaceae bacterium]